MINKKLVLLFTVLFTSLSLYANVSFKQENFNIYDMEKNTAKIKKGNLSLGQSGVIYHTYSDKNSIILATAEVIKSYKDYSLIKISDFTDLKQDALPTTSKIVKNNDTFILNYLYSASLLIAPNQESFVNVRRIFSYHNFVHSDVYASFLKIEGEPYPSKELIQEYTRKENIGTIFYAIEGRVYIYDAKSFKQLASFVLPYDDDDTQLPFYTRVEKIEEGQFSWLKSLSFDSTVKMLRTLGFLPKDYDEYDDYEEIDEEGNIIKNEKLLPSEQYNLYYKKFLGLDKD